MRAEPAEFSPLLASLRRILAIRLDNIGDVVMTGPALRALRQNYPAAEITLMANNSGSQAAPLLPWVDDVIPWRAVWQEIGQNAPVDVEKEMKLVALLSERAFDAAFIFTSFAQSPHPPAYACYLAGIPVRVGQSKEFGGALLTHWVKPLPDSAHQVERSLHLLRSVGLPAPRGDLELVVRPEAKAGAQQVMAQAGLSLNRPYIALAPGASAESRRYDEARFARAAQILAKQAGMPVVLLGSEREAGQFPFLEAAARDRSSGMVSLIGLTRLPEMAAVIECARVVIANNSGSMHIAAAFNRPMVILFAGTELIEQWAPATAGAVMLNRPVPCSPCHAFRCPYQMECLDISPEEVASAAAGLLLS